MKKTFLLITAVAAALLAGAGRLSACEIYFELSKATLTPGVTSPVSLFVKFEHRRCDISIKDTRIEGKNVEIVSRGKWTEIRSGFFRLDLEIKPGPGKSELRAVRECDKKGVSEGVREVNLK